MVKKGLTSNQIIVLIPFCIILALIQVAIWSDILVYKAPRDVLSIVSVLLFSSILLLFVFSLLLNRNFRKLWFSKEGVNGRKNRPILAAISVFVIVPLFTHIAVIRGIPAVINLAPFGIGSQVVTVVETTSSKSCRRGAEINEFSGFINNEICGLPRWAWESLNPGDKLELIGKKSPVSFSYQKFIIIKNGEEGEF
ncbi:hypothetical protein [Photobacterium lutimaris]|uniref:hypothetical protein n=1 Tax=Photobacterium lutimaris TaxID=388278 RepID=UPI0011B26FEB|nr:hypothetical protein [Photobacterium lutimaris]